MSVGGFNYPLFYSAGLQGYKIKRITIGLQTTWDGNCTVTVTNQAIKETAFTFVSFVVHRFLSLNIIFFLKLKDIVF